MTKMIYAIAALLILGGLAYNYRALEIFNFLMPKDSGSKLIKADISFGADPRQKLDVYAPSEGTGPWPVIVFIHGGSWNSGSKDAYSFVGRALAAQGYLVALPNYRLTHQAPFPPLLKTVPWRWTGPRATLLNMAAMKKMFSAWDIRQALIT